LLASALLLVSISVAFGAISGAVSVTAGVLDHSLGVLAVGLAVLADLTGSAVLIWRFRAERDHPVDAAEVEARASVIVTAALVVISVALTFESIRALLASTHPGSSAITLASAGVAVLMLTPLAYLKRSTAAALASGALRGDSTLSAIGAATALLALIGLLLYRTLGWWWADRVVALLIAGTAAAEAYGIARTPLRRRT
jgi:divalent metal cation (Fe/Co/Zn/Cd) transporter